MADLQPIQDGAPPSSIDNQTAEVTSDPAPAPNPQANSNRNPQLRVPSQIAEPFPQPRSTIADDNTNQCLTSQSVADDHSSPFYLSNGDHPCLVLVSTVLNGPNYQPWKRGNTMALAAKNKIAFINGSLPRPEPGNISLNSWLRCNNMVMSWLVNSVSPEIAQSIMYFDLATEMWNDLAERFNEGNGPRIFQLQTQITRLQQGDQSVSAYFTKLKSLWDELKEFQPITTCTCGAMKVFLDCYNQNQVLQFLTGLNESFASVRAQILLIEPIPNLSRVFAMIIQEERQRSLGSADPIPLAAAAGPSNPSRAKKPRPSCSNCGKPGHLVDKCYFLHGFQPGYGDKKKQEKGKAKANNASSNTPKSDLDGPHTTADLSSQCQQLISLLSQQLNNHTSAEPNTMPAAALNLAGIIHYHSCVERPQQNSVVERKHQHILNVARALGFQSNLSLVYWPYLVQTATYLINRTPSKLFKSMTSYQELHGTPPKYDHLRSFGCLAYGSTLNSKRHKFTPRSRASVFIGYPQGMKAYLLLDIETKQTYISRDVVFYETIFSLFSTTSPSKVSTLFPDLVLPTIQPVHQPNAHPTMHTPACQSAPLSGAQPALHSGNITPPSYPADSTPTAPTPAALIPEFSPISGQKSATIPGSSTISPALGTNDAPTAVPKPAPISDVHATSMTSTRAGRTITKPKHLTDYVFLFKLNHKVMSHPKPHWLLAMDKETDALEKNNTWIVTKLPPGQKAIGCKWVYKVKYNESGAVERFKARLVAKGYTQRHGIDYSDTYAPVAKFNTLKTFLALSAMHNWNVHQLDINNAFLHGDLHEEVYMKIPPGYKAPPNTVCKLNKSIYGLKQASRQWFSKLSHTLISDGFTQSLSDNSLFIKRTNTFFLSILIYVDDIIVASNNDFAISHFKTYLHGKFKLKDLGTIRFFLGLEIGRTKRGISVSQTPFTVQLLKDTGYIGAKPVSTPMETNLKLSSDKGILLPDPTFFRSLIGKLIYLTITRPDISYAINHLSQFLTTPRVPHLHAAHRISMV
uniref:CCHC-type domain-containing protein n=1 Tax=Cannabis sativa TaxID=3483 RepID=A0A803P4N1_CANSA